MPTAAPQNFMYRRGQKVLVEDMGADPLLKLALVVQSQVDSIRLTNRTYHFAAEFAEVGG